MADEQEKKDEDVKIAGVPVGVFAKLFDRIGLAPILLIALAFGTWTYMKFEEGNNFQRQIVMIKKLNRIEQVVRAEKGCKLDLDKQIDEDKVFQNSK